MWLIEQEFGGIIDESLITDINRYLKFDFFLKLFSGNIFYVLV